MLASASPAMEKPPRVEPTAGRSQEANAAVAGKPVSRLYYWTFVVLVCALGMLSAVLALVCIAAPYMLVMAVPAVLLTIRGVKECRSMKKRIRTKHRRH